MKWPTVVVVAALAAAVAVVLGACAVQVPGLVDCEAQGPGASILFELSCSRPPLPPSG